MMEATLPKVSGLTVDTRRFHLWMAGVFILIAFGGFMPTYWVPVATGKFHNPSIVHVHGILLFAWTGFYFLQTAWVASGRVATHRAWGLFGIALFSLMLCSIIATKITLIRLDDARGFGDASRRFSAVAFLTLPYMIGLFWLAIANVRRPEIHKRLMFVLMANLMTPAIARVMLVLFFGGGAGDGGPPPPAFVAVPPWLLADLLIGVAIAYDWRTRGRPHPVYLYGGLISVVMPFAILFFSGTETWMAIARALERLPG